jgi:hypothetical protein
MMGQNSGNQNRLFYSLNLEEHVPANHLLRGIDRFLDLSDLRAYLAPFYSHTGRPSIDPELMIRVLIVAEKATFWPFFWRRGGDSNSRSSCELAGFQDRCIQPLCHLSVLVESAG